MAPPEISDSLYMEEENQSLLQFRRYSQSQLISNSTAKETITIPYTRGRSFSTSVVPGSSLEAQIINVSLEYEKSSYFMGESWEMTHALLLGSKRLLLLEELPQDRRENQYVLSGYRFYRSNKSCLKSLFKLHNETINIWSHLLGFFFFLSFTLNVFHKNFPEASTQDLIVFSAFSISALTCLLCSSIYHTFVCHSKRKIKAFTATLDYIGITFLIIATNTTIVHFGFYCEPIAKHNYITFNCLTGGIFVILSLFPFFDTKKYRSLRIGLFVSLAVSSIIPLLHLASLKGLVETLIFLKHTLMGCLMYILGVIIYGNRFPEKFFPGKYDSIGLTSHAIWHIFVCFGIFFHYISSFYLYKLREEYGCMLQ